MGVQNIHFLTTWPKKRAPPKNYKIRGFQQPIFWKTDLRHENRHFGPKNPRTNIPVITCLPLSSLSTNSQKYLKPLFLWCFSKPKKENFQNLNLKQGDLKKNIRTLSLKKVIFRKLPDHWAQKETQNDNRVCKIVWNHYKYRPKVTLDQLIILTWTS